MAFLYTLGIIIFYVLYDEKYRENENIPTAVSELFHFCLVDSGTLWSSRKFIQRSFSL